MNFGPVLSFILCVASTFFILIPTSYLTFQLIEQYSANVGKKMLLHNDLDRVNSTINR
jgi:CHASE3 domain sensor protein